LAVPLFGQGILDASGQQRQIRVIPLGSAVSAIPAAGEVAAISGKPYSAIARTVEYSPDGKHVDRSESNRVFRDEQGRTRREANGGKTFLIFDPVVGLSYNLETETKTAMTRSVAAARPLLHPANAGPIHLKLNQTCKGLYETVARIGGFNVLWDPEITPPVKNQFNIELSSATLEEALNYIAAMTRSYWRPIDAGTIFVTDDTPVKRAAASPMPSAAPRMSIVEAAREQAKSMPAANIRVDDLGTQVVNGVTAQGVRTTSVIPTGTFGNDHDIKTVTERWVSEDLHVLVKSVYTDSRTGSTVYDLVNISLAPPDASLFQLPGGYTVQEGGRGARGGRGGGR
jgi:hypothetical protein